MQRHATLVFAVLCKIPFASSTTQLWVQFSSVRYTLKAGWECLSPSCLEFLGYYLISIS